jgi:hypothetical protein
MFLVAVMKEIWWLHYNPCDEISGCPFGKKELPYFNHENKKNTDEIQPSFNRELPNYFKACCTSPRTRKKNTGEFNPVSTMSYRTISGHAVHVPQLTRPQTNPKPARPDGGF